MPCCSTNSVTATQDVTEVREAVSQATMHLHMHVSDLGHAIDFYCAFFGETPVKLQPGYAKFLPRWASVNLALTQAGTTDFGGVVNHLGIQLPDAASVHTHLARVQAAGLVTRVEMGVNCCFSNQDKFWVRDPMGMEWEVYYLNHDTEPEIGLLSSASTSSCCNADG